MMNDDVVVDVSTDPHGSVHESNECVEEGESSHFALTLACNGEHFIENGEVGTTHNLTGLATETR